MCATPPFPTALRRARVLAACAALLCAAGAAPTQAQGAHGDAAAKAKFTVMLSRFVQWPPGALPADGAPLRLCVIHNSPTVAQAFARHGGETAGGRVVTIVANPGAGPAAAPCNVVFVDASAGRQAADAVVRTGNAPALLVGALDGFALQGGMVELVNVNDTLRFDVNVGALRHGHLGLSSQVLKLARQLHD
jgi:YfiR/HmsC-like